MELVNLTIHVVPVNVPFTDLSDVSSRNTGTNLSTVRTVRISKVPNGYAILYTDDVFAQLNAVTLIDYIVQLFATKMPGKSVRIMMEYHFELNDGMDVFDDDIGNLLKEMEDYLVDVENSINLVKYSRSDSMDDVVDILSEDDDDSDEDDNDDSEDDEDFDPDNIDDILRMIGSDRDRSKKGKSKGRPRKEYGESRVIHESKNPKRSYNRHGLMICSDKDALKHDQKMIKEFLKDFIPGSAEWKKEFRKDLEKRWMQMFVVSKKQLKHLQKHHAKGKNKKKRGIDAEKAIDFTRRVFNVPSTPSAWNDPNR
ncbi:MAG: hypothetical protein NC548_13130 [Lachnospiraceae bacterium]|nr:hypothetical protein [Lachnospiraceae bacterium]MCM1230667.1 hypothetical protein [Ruminococcus flavefaciens]